MPDEALSLYVCTLYKYQNALLSILHGFTSSFTKSNVFGIRMEYGAVINSLGKLPIHPEGYLTMDDIFLYTRDEMHVKYLFWNCYYEGADNGERSSAEAIAVIRKHPTFNVEN